MILAMPCCCLRLLVMHLKYGPPCWTSSNHTAIIIYGMTVTPAEREEAIEMIQPAVRRFPNARR